MTHVALTWFVYDRTRSARALGWLAFCYMAPVIVGGLAAGSLLDRFDRRRIMVADNVARGFAVAAIPALHAFGMLALWHVYMVASIYGLLMMISLAGVPSLIPALVNEDDWPTANALETLSFTLAGAAAPLIAGVLIVRIGAPNVLLLDAVTYFAFAVALTRIRIDAPASAPRSDGAPQSLREAVGLLARNKVLLSTTIMFLVFNIAAAGIEVWLPIFVDTRLGSGPPLYGALLGAMAVGEVAGAFLAGAWTRPLPLGRFICVGQTLSGLSLAVALFAQQAWVLAVGLMLFGAFSGPLTIWAQTLRMRIIPDRMRGTTFALLRTIMQAGGPVGGLAAGRLLPMAGMAMTIGLSALVVAGAGVSGLQVKALRTGGTGPGQPGAAA
jgi:MFS family permease